MVLVFFQVSVIQWGNQLLKSYDIGGTSIETQPWTTDRIIQDWWSDTGENQSI
jgi:hypothetical protein